MAGYSWEESNDNDGFKLTTYNFYNDVPTYPQPGDGLQSDINVSDWVAAGMRLRTHDLLLQTANYSFNSKYMFQATVRRDGLGFR